MIKALHRDYRDKLRRLLSVMLPIICTQMAIMGMNFFDASMSGQAGEPNEKTKTVTKQAVAAAAPSAQAAAPDKKKLTYAERLELQRLEQELGRSEAELKMLALEMNNCGSNYGKLAELTARQQEVQSKLEEMEERWLYLSEFAE